MALFHLVPLRLCRHYLHFKLGKTVKCICAPEEMAGLIKIYPAQRALTVQQCAQAKKQIYLSDTAD